MCLLSCLLSSCGIIVLFSIHLKLELLAQFIGLNYEKQFKFKLLNSISIDLPI